MIEDSLRQSIYRLPQIGDSTYYVKKSTERLFYVGKGNREDTSGHDGTFLPFSLERSDGVFALILLCFLFFTHIYNGGFSFLKENVRLIYSSGKSRKIYSQITSKEVLYNYLLVFQAIVLVSICLYDIFIKYIPIEYHGVKPLIAILLFITLLSLFIALKYLLYKFIGYVFDAAKVMIVWRNTFIVSIQLLGILYFIPTLLLIYSEYYHSVIIGFMLILFLIVQIILFYRIIIFFIKEKFNFLFLIAYLCSVEILPYIFLSAGLVYLYRIDVY